MKKNVLKLASFAAGLCVAMTLTSCHNGEDTQPTLVPNVVQLDARTLFVHTNVNATVKGVNFNYTGTNTADFEIPNPPASGAIKITADGRQDKTITFNFKDGVVLYYDIELVTAGKTYTQAEVETGGATVENGDENKKDNDGVAASFALNGANNTGNTGEYSITVFTPDETSADVDNIKNGWSSQETPLAIECKPDGAQFDTPIDVVVTIPGSAGYNISVENPENKTENIPYSHNGETVTAKLSHFSVYDFILKMVCQVEPVVDTKNYETTVNAMEGSAKITVPYGYEINDEEIQKSPIVKMVLKKMFGTPRRDITKTVKWEAVNGTAKVTATQEVKTYTFNAGKNIVVTVYGRVSTNVSIETTQPEEVKTHGGGSN